MDYSAIGTMELRVLQALCQGTPQGSIREETRRLLHSYSWQDQLYQVIYEALLSIPSESPEMIRSQLPARMTRRGFPDFEIEALFTPHARSKAEIEKIMQQLGETSREERV